MHLHIRLAFLLAIAPVATAAPLLAAAQDGPGVVKKDGGYLIDYDNQRLPVVLSALAEAAGLNIILGDIPNERTTLRMGEPVPREQLLDLIRNIVEANNLTMTMDGSLIRIERSRRSRGQPSLTATADLALFTYRLKHTSAAQLAPVLMNLVSGTGSRRGGNIPGQNNRAVSDNRTVSDNRGGPAGRGGVTIPLRGGGVDLSSVVTQFEFNGQRVPPEQSRQVVQDFLEAAANQGAQGSSGSDGLSSFANEVRIVAEEATNTLLVRAAADDWDLIKKIIESVDLRPLQVLIEVTIVEVTRSKSLDVGIDATVTHTKDGRVQRAELPGVAGARDFILALTGGRGAIDFTAALNALASRGELRVVSLPIIIAQNNKQAMLNVGSSRPFIQVSQTVPNDPTGRVETIQYLDVGTTLTLTPTINADGYVNLVVTQTANTATNEIQFDAPVLSKREATTQIFLRDGQTTVIGGLADNVRDRVRSGIPVLSWIPIIGGLFRTTHDSDVQSELYLFLTPHIISEDKDIDRLRDAVQQESDLLRSVPLQQRIPARLADTISTAPAPPSSVLPAVRTDSVRPSSDVLPRPRRGPRRPFPGDSLPAPVEGRAPE